MLLQWLLLSKLLSNTKVLFSSNIIQDQAISDEVVPQLYQREKGISTYYLQQLIFLVSRNVTKISSSLPSIVMTSFIYLIT